LPLRTAFLLRRVVYKWVLECYILRGDDGHLVFVPKGKRVEVSLIDLSPCPGGLEAAVIYGEAFIAFHRGLTLTAEEALSETLLEA